MKNPTQTIFNIVAIIVIILLAAPALGYEWQWPVAPESPAVITTQVTQPVAAVELPAATQPVQPAAEVVQPAAPATLDDKVVVAFGGKQAITGNPESGHEGIWAIHTDWLGQAGGYGLQGNLIALFCGNNGENIPSDASCRSAAQAFVNTWKPTEGLDYEFMNDGSFQFARVEDRLYIFDWDASVQPNQVSSIKWTGSSFIACQNDSGPAGKFNGDGLTPCVEITTWVPWSEAASVPGFAPYLSMYNQLALPTSADLLLHGNPILLATFRK